MFLVKHLEPDWRSMALTWNLASLIMQLDVALIIGI